ncbi:MAG TPA: hypothetical protein VNF29_02290 [Candidatus Binataceae bacterium]|nr:hypothetical protein [Candidatus Binataceae bacterium]
MLRSAMVGALCGAAFIAGGCAVQGRPFKKAAFSANDAVIYVYRPYSYASSVLVPQVTCGGQTARIGPGGYHAFIVPAGKVACGVKGGESADQTEILAEPRNYYVREEFGWGVLSGHPHLNPIDTDTAHDEIQSCVLEP